MVKSNKMDPDKQQRADKAAECFEAAFIEQFNRCFERELPPRDVGVFTADGTTNVKGSGHFLKALKALKGLTDQERTLLHAQAKAKEPPMPATTIRGRKLQSPALAAFQELPEADKEVFYEVYGKQRMPKDSPCRFVEDMPKAMLAFVRHDIRKIKLSGKLVEAAKQKLDGQIDEEIYHDTVKKHTQQLMQCERIKMDMLSPEFKYRLISHALEQLPQLMQKHDPEQYAEPMQIGEDGHLR